MGLCLCLLWHGRPRAARPPQRVTIDVPGCGVSANTTRDVIDDDDDYKTGGI